LKKLAASLLLTIALSGCGTLSQGCLTPYGGTIIDTVGVVRSIPFLPIMALYLVDLPFSFVADTLILPFVIIDMATYNSGNK